MLLSQEIFKCHQQASIHSVVEGRPGGRQKTGGSSEGLGSSEKSRRLKAFNPSQGAPSSQDAISLVFSREVTAYKQNSKWGQVLLECNGILPPAGQTFLREKKL